MVRREDDTVTTQGKKPTLAPGTQARLKEKAERDDQAFKAKDDMLRRRATEGVYDQETLDAVLALGGDATRSSPVREQVLPDAEPGLTTTTGAYRVPIDPTTAAVPASEHSDIALAIRGTPTVGSSGHGEPEERWKGGRDIGDRIERLNNLPTTEDRNWRHGGGGKEHPYRASPQARSVSPVNLSGPA